MCIWRRQRIGASLSHDAQRSRDHDDRARKAPPSIEVADIIALEAALASNPAEPTNNALTALSASVQITVVTE
jgi:hypothetical protein